MPWYGLLSNNNLVAQTYLRSTQRWQSVTLKACLILLRVTPTRRGTQAEIRCYAAIECEKIFRSLAAIF